MTVEMATKYEVRLLKSRSGTASLGATWAYCSATKTPRLMNPRINGTRVFYDDQVYWVPAYTMP